MPPTKHIDFGFRVARVARRLRQAVDAELRAYGLTEATWRPLAYVGRLGDGVRQKELATALAIEGPSLVRLLDSLERRGLIERREEEPIAGRAHLSHPLRPPPRRACGKSGNRDPGPPAHQRAAAELETCQRVLDGIERALDERLDMAAPLQV